MLILWKQLILSDHDFCSQLWNPHKVGDIQSLELMQRSFLSKISGMHHFSYWDQLKELKLSSLERRRERYIAIYIWRILEGSAPNISDSHGISFKWHPRRGRVCIVPPISSSTPARIQTIRFASFAVKGPRIFNSLPRSLRNFTGGTVDVFKHRLDTYLQNVPDQPLIPGYTEYRSVDSNSLLSWAAHQAWHRPEDTVVPMFQQSLRVDQPGSP